MTSDDIDRLIRRYLAAAMSVLVLLVAPGTGDGAPPGAPPATVRPEAAAPDRAHADTSDDADRAGSAGAASSAAVKHDWGRPTHVDEFSKDLGKDWGVYDGPGHGGNGKRSPSAVSVDNGILTLTGDSKGTTAGMAWDTEQRYGRWEGRVKAPAASDSYHALLLLWPDAENFPVGGEIDFMEMLDGDRQATNLFLHYGKDNSQVSDEVEVDATTWHNWALEWTPRSITAYLDGEQWFRSTDQKTFPPGPMHLCVQLDWFPKDGGSRTSTMQVDWVKQYSVDSAGHSSDQKQDSRPSGKRSGEGTTGYTTSAWTAPAPAGSDGWRWVDRERATNGSAPASSGTGAGGSARDAARARPNGRARAVPELTRRSHHEATS